MTVVTSDEPDHYRDEAMPDLDLDLDASPGPSRGAAGETAGDSVRAALLRGAHDLLASEGPAALTVRRIAAAAGVSTMNVYSRFGGKDGVLNALFVDGFRRLGVAVSASPDTDDPLADLRACGVGYRRFASEHPTYYRLMFDGAADFEPTAEAELEALASLAKVVARVQRAIDAGIFAAGDPFVVAAGMWALNHGLASLSMKVIGTHGDHFDWERIAAVALDAHIAGLTVPPPPT